MRVCTALMPLIGHRQIGVDAAGLLVA